MIYINLNTCCRVLFAHVITRQSHMVTRCRARCLCAPSRVSRTLFTRVVHGVALFAYVARAVSLVARCPHAILNHSIIITHVN
jgi:hypothetical protein